jgi:hypothetical protein
MKLKICLKLETQINFQILSHIRPTKVTQLQLVKVKSKQLLQEDEVDQKGNPKTKNPQTKFNQF